MVESGNRFHILVVIADGQMEEEEPTVAGRDVLHSSNKIISFTDIEAGPTVW